MTLNKLVKQIKRISPAIVAVRGEVGTGKSTTARDLGDRLGWPVVSSDKIGFAVYGEAYFDDADRAQKKARVNLALVEIVTEYLESGQAVVLDRTHLSQADCLCTQSLGRVLWVNVVCSEPVQFQRLARRIEGLSFWMDVRARMRANWYDPIGPALQVDTTNGGGNNGR